MCITWKQAVSNWAPFDCWMLLLPKRHNIRGTVLCPSATRLQVEAHRAPVLQRRCLLRVLCCAPALGLLLCSLQANPPLLGEGNAPGRAVVLAHL